ncbi:hypothetical protein AB6C70_25335, partial [Vibrio splendidus]
CTCFFRHGKSRYLGERLPQNTITISITLGKDGSTQKIAPKEELFFHDTPSDFDGKVLQIFNQTSSQHAGTAEITVNGVR